MPHSLYPPYVVLQVGHCEKIVESIGRFPHTLKKYCRGSQRKVCAGLTTATAPALAHRVVSLVKCIVNVSHRMTAAEWREGEGPAQGVRGVTSKVVANGHPQPRLVRQSPAASFHAQVVVPPLSGDVDVFVKTKYTRSGCIRPLHIAEDGCRAGRRGSKKLPSPRNRP